MNKVYIGVVVTLLMVAGMCSCAQTTSESYQEKELRTLDAWMELHVNVGGVEVAKKIRDGMYMEWLNNGPSDGPSPEVGEWLELNYEGKTFEKEKVRNIFMTRSEQTAKRLKTHSPYTHYVPHYMLYSRNNMMYGQFLALGKMKQGDKVRLYLSSELTEGLANLTYDNGHAGQFSVPTGRMMIIEMELVNIVKEPDGYEQAQVEKRATDPVANGGLGLMANDTISKWLYLKVLEYELDDEKRDTIGIDSTTRIRFTGRFLDNFIFDTNMPDIGHAADRDTLSYKEMVYKPSIKEESENEEDRPSGAPIAAFYRVFKSRRLTYDSKIVILTSSVHAYGTTGIDAGVVPYTIIQPYSPMIFEITILPKEDEE